MAFMGGKGNAYRRIIGAMPPHAVYIETHLGGGSVMRHKRPAPRQIGIDADATVIKAWQHERPSICELVQGDAAEFLCDYKFTGNELVYCDPPYPRGTRASRQVYSCDYSDSDHRRLLDVLTTIPCNVMISGGHDHEYLRRLSAWRRIEFRAGARSGARDEVLWMNFQEPAQLHDARYRGANFRERERLKRRFQTLTRKVESLDASERALFAEWFTERFPEMEQRRKEWC